MTLPEPYYDVDGITIYHSRCEDVLPHIAPDDVALVLTDPPYGIATNTDYSARMHYGSRVWGIGVTGDDAPLAPTTLLAFGRCVLFGANYYHDRLPVASWIVWRKRGMSPVMADAELAWHNAGGKRVSYIETAHKHTYTVDGVHHPTQKPVALMRWILDSWTGPDDLVLDPYMGSGPVARACADLGRRYIGVEVVEDYCRVAVDRLRQGVLDLGGVG